MRCRRLRTSNIDPKRPQRDLWTTDRLDSTGATGHFSTANQEINFFALQ